MEAEVIQPRREAGKAQRRRRIVQAATALAWEVDFDSASMEQIATRAGVSPATLYNLFQTKGAIFREILEQDFENYVKKVLSADTDSEIERIFLAIDLGASLCKRNANFYRTMAHLQNSQQIGSEASGPRRAFWRDRVTDAVSAGELRPELDATLLSGIMVQIMRGLGLDWAAGTITLDQWADEAAYGFALLLRNYVTKKSEPGVISRIKRLEGVLVGTGKSHRK